MPQGREIIDEVRSATDLLEVVREYSKVKLKKRGQNWVGLCPFHNERTPSFNVNPDRGYFKCFGCGKSGDVFAYVMESNGFTFGEALRSLAKRANIHLPSRSRGKSDQERQRRDPLYHALRFAADFFETQLSQSSKVQDFLSAREFNPDTVKRFRLGYAADKWHALINEAAKHQIEVETLVAAGLVKQHEKGHHYDAFRNRLMFPIWSTGNQIVGFGGRRLFADKHTPKYLNSPETDVYHKSVVLYGLTKGRSAIRQYGEAILVEGYTDVLALHQAGVENVVAGCGTALTQTQVKILSRYTKTIVLIFDADEAGIAAAERALDLVLENGLTPYVVSLPDGADPDSFVRDHGADKFREFIASRRVNFVRFVHNRARQNRHLSTPEGRTASIRSVLAKIDQIKDPVLSNEYLNLASDQFKVSVEQLTQWKHKAPFHDAPQSGHARPTPDLQLLDIMLQHGTPVINYVFSYMDAEDFSEGPYRRLAANLHDLAYEHGDAVQIPVSAKLLAADSEVQHLAAEISFPKYQLSHNWEKQDIEVPDMNEDPFKIARDNIAALKKQMIEAAIDKAYEQYQNARPESPERNAFMEDVMVCLKMRKEIESGAWFDRLDAAAHDNTQPQ